jgi:hypothetical protein
MYVIRLDNGRLRVPHSETGEGDFIAQAYVEIGPEDPDYDRLSEQALSEDELAEKQRVWREEDEALRLQFEQFKEAQNSKNELADLRQRLVATQQRVDFGLTEPAVSARCADAADATGGGPASDGLGVHSEQGGHLSRGQQALARTLHGFSPPLSRSGSGWMDYKCAGSRPIHALFSQNITLRNALTWLYSGK